ncbi:MAG: M48 family metallopeptidase [Ideonella sp.]|nr:M48 family metallopeptidase [Ideonella sp.]
MKPNLRSEVCCASAQRRQLLVLAGAALALPALAREGVDVGKKSWVAGLVPADQLERAAGQQYLQMLQQASQQRALAPANNPQLVRLRAIAKRIIPYSYEWNERARQWKWEVNLFGGKQVNAFCMPGGKIAFFYGLLDRLQLSDDEVAMVMGHEIAHALREHARERVGKDAATRGAIEIGAALLGLGGGGRYLADMGGQLVTLKFGRDDESESDLIGMELAARAGYDPRSGVTLWNKMAAANKGAPPEWLSTHPSGDSRIKDIEAALPLVMPLYERAAKPERVYGPPAPRVAPAASAGAR